MSLWWARKDQLDPHQIRLIEDLALTQDHLVLGPPGSGKTNVLLRRAQFVRSQGMPNVSVLTFTRPLTEFITTGCFDAQGREIFPESCISTLESWIRGLYSEHDTELPDRQADLRAWKATLASGALHFSATGRLPRYDALFVDEAQDLMDEEVQLLRQWGRFLFFVGDDRQRIYDHANGLHAIRQIVAPLSEAALPFHYRLAPEICAMADRIQLPIGGTSLAATGHYQGPRPGTIDPHGPMQREEQLRQMAAKLKGQLRAYADFIRQGDRIGILVARKANRQVVLDFLESDSDLADKSQIIRARGEGEAGFDPSFDPDRPISILTVAGCKGLEFRAVHWLFCDDLLTKHNAEHYYTVVTRAKTSFDFYCTDVVPQTLARSYAAPAQDLW